MSFNINQSIADAIRFLSIDAIKKSNSGHPGMPMGMADIATVLWLKYLNHNPQNPKWINRDRFILSNGHGSMLLYALLHLTGYNFSIDDLKNFRKLHSKTPGHPEYNISDGIEATTGPLGQGLANGVGMALAEKLLSNRFNKKDSIIIDHFIYVFVGDGCLMEGISHEVCSLAGTLKLEKLIVFWDKNNISIDGEVKHWFNENVSDRYKSYGWNIIDNIDGHNFKSIDDAIYSARKNKNSPTLLCFNTNIGHGSPNQSGTCQIHGAPLNDLEVEQTRKNLNWIYPPFKIPQYIYKTWNAIEKGNLIELKWQKKIDYYQANYYSDYQELLRRLNRNLPSNFSCVFNNFVSNLLVNKPFVSTRKASHMFINEFYSVLPEFLGGSADLTSSNLTSANSAKWINYFPNDSRANYLSYGVREFGMSSIMNGISLYNGFIVYGGTFLVFSDYSRNAIRMSAIMRQPIIYIMTHDSIGLGEDGPTHQPIEHLPSLRLIPNLNVWRPGDSIETAIAWENAIKENFTPSVLVLSRQNIPFLLEDSSCIPFIQKGGYLIKKSKAAIVTLISTGSELSIAIDAHHKLKKLNIDSNVVSLPCVEKFLLQNKLYRNFVIKPNIPAVIIEASQPDLWHTILPKAGGKIIGINQFGLSAPANDIYQSFGITSSNIIHKVKDLCDIY